MSEGTFHKRYNHSLERENLGKFICPFWCIVEITLETIKERPGGECNLTDHVCRLGITEVVPHKDCPLRRGDIVISWDGVDE